jgi:ubiquinone/menaquinone biosynthesis C-methylase UbiE
VATRALSRRHRLSLMSDDVRSRFAPVAANYARAKFHSSVEGLREVLALAQPEPGDLALDVATGTGHVALALAPHLRRVYGLDLTREMLDQARRLASERSVENVSWVIGDAERLPFGDETFDLYSVRAAPHHFHDVDAFLHEAHRVLRPDRHAVFVDCAPPLPARDVLHEVEVRRDPSHVLSMTVDEWVERLEHAGFEVESAIPRELDWDFEDWMQNMEVAAPLVSELAAVVEASEGKAREQLRPERRDGRLWHAYWHCLIRARKPE